MHQSIRIYSRRGGAVVPPLEAVYVGRPTQWGNPYSTEDWGHDSAARLFYSYALDRLIKEPSWLKPLVGKDLVCWCKPTPDSEVECHAEWLDSLANGYPNQFGECPGLREIQGNLFDYTDYSGNHSPVICIPTNGIVGRNGLIMGAGVALAAQNLCPILPKVWGAWVSKNGNIPCKYYSKQLDKTFISFPTKNNYKDDSSYELIGESAWYLNRLVSEERYEEVHLPAVGAGKGNLDWNKVHSVLKLHLDNRYTIVGQRPTGIILGGK